MTNSGMSSFTMLYFKNHTIYLDHAGHPLPDGTVLEDPFSPHQGIVAYTQSLEQIILHNSKRYGRAVATFPEEFNGGRQVRVVRTPETPEEAARAVENAWSDVQRGVLWSGLDNCQDLVSRAYTGENGSKTRDAIVFSGFAAALLFALAN